MWDFLCFLRAKINVLNNQLKRYHILPLGANLSEIFGLHLTCQGDRGRSGGESDAHLIMSRFMFLILIKYGGQF